MRGQRSKEDICNSNLLMCPHWKVKVDHTRLVVACQPYAGHVYELNNWYTPDNPQLLASVYRQIFALAGM